jgi:four helix bundle protein
MEKEMNKDDMKHRTRQFALRVIRLVESLPKGRTEDVLGKQLLRSGTSVGANYRAACRAKSTADFVYKMRIVEEEADESLYWMELLIEAKIMESKKLEPLMKEADELLAITVASIKTAKKTKQNPKSAFRNPKL